MPTEQHFEVSCSPDRAFDGFTDRAKIVDWWGDSNVYKTVSWAADLRDGGSWRAEFEAPDGARFGAEGMYVSIDRPTRLKWTWKADWEPEVEKTIHMSFMPSPAGTKMIVATEGYLSAEAQSQDEAAWAMIVGWFNRAVSKQGE
jgi:uncharacterized protein YndB with AHSA1/START domain